MVETPSGLQYKVLRSGKEEGKTPLVSTKCLCHYRGKFLSTDGPLTLGGLTCKYVQTPFLAGKKGRLARQEGLRSFETNVARKDFNKLLVGGKGE